MLTFWISFIVDIKVHNCLWSLGIKEGHVVRSANTSQAHAGRDNQWTIDNMDRFHHRAALQIGLDEGLEIGELCLSIIHSHTVLHLSMQLRRLEYDHLAVGVGFSCES